MNRLQLTCHPTTPCPVSLAISVKVRATEQGGKTALAFEFEATGDLGRLRIPRPALLPAPADGLWQHTCFEAFVSSPCASAYEEFNFSPSGEWAHYAFTRERERDGIGHRAGLPGIQATSSPSALTLCANATVSPTQRPLAVGLSAVIELDDGSLSYWAMHHPKAQPDFHDRAGWTLSL